MSEIPYRLKTLSKAGEGMYANVFVVLAEDQKKALRVVKKKKEEYLNEGIASPLEIDILSRLRHPNLMFAEKLISTPETGGISILLPYAPSTYHESMNQDKLSMYQRLDICFKVICAARYLLQCNILHLDIKPDNILIKDNLEPLLADFDICARMDDPKIPITLDREIFTPQIRPYELLIHPGSPIGEYTLAWELGMLLILSFGPFLPDPEPQKVIKHLEKYFPNLDVSFGHLHELFSRNIADESIVLELSDLVSHMIDFNIITRYSLDKVLRHSVWRNLAPGKKLTTNRDIVEGKTYPVELPIYVECPSSVERLYNHTMSYYTLYHEGSKLPSGIFFASLDLLYRTAYLFTTSNMREHIIHEIACNYIGWKLYNFYMHRSKLLLLRNKNGFLKSNPYSVCYNITAAEVVTMEAKLILLLGGILYRPYIYDSGVDLIECMNNVVFNPGAYYSFTGGGNTNKPLLDKLLGSRTAIL